MQQSNNVFKISYLQETLIFNIIYMAILCAA